MNKKIVLGIIAVCLLIGYAGFNTFFVEDDNDCPKPFVKGGDSIKLAKYPYRIKSTGIMTPKECLTQNGDNR